MHRLKHNVSLTVYTENVIRSNNILNIHYLPDTFDLKYLSNIKRHTWRNFLEFHECKKHIWGYIC